MRALVFLTAMAIVTIWLAVEHHPETAVADPVRASRPREIQSIAIDGRGLPVSALYELVASRIGEVIDDDKLARDRAVLEEGLIARGYLTAHVRAPQVVIGDGGAAFVTFSIAQGPLFRVRSVRVSGAAERDVGVVTLASGEVVMADRIAHARETLAQRLAVRGKPSVVVANLERDVGAAAVDVELVAR